MFWLGKEKIHRERRKVLYLLFQYVIYIITFINNNSNQILNIWYVLDFWNILTHFCPHNNPIGWVLLFSLDRWWNWSLKKLSDLPKLTHLVSGKAKIHIQVFLNLKVVFLLPCFSGMWKRVHFLCVLPENSIRTLEKTSKEQIQLSIMKNCLIVRIVQRWNE